MHLISTRELRRIFVPFIAGVVVVSLAACGSTDGRRRGEGGACGGFGACETAGDGSGAFAGLDGGNGGAANGGSGTIQLPSGGAEADAGGSGCIRERVNFEKELPNVMLVVDGSGSMILPDFDGDTRWEAVKRALIEPNTGLVARLQSDVRFGLTLYFSSPPSGEPDEGCPILDQVNVGLENFEAISTRFQQAYARGSTPTGETLERVWPALAALDAEEFSGPRVILLATDGEPTTCAGASEQAEGRARSLSAVESAYSANIRTFVIAVGRELGDDHLRELANLGQGHDPNDPADRFYRVLDTAELGTAFEEIATSVRECIFELNGTVEASSAAFGEVTLNGVTLGHEDPDGWRLLGPSQLALVGRACESLQEGEEAALDISFPCGVFRPR